METSDAAGRWCDKRFLAVHFRGISAEWPAQMNKNLLPLARIALLGLILLAGCETDRTKPPTIFPQETVHALQPARPVSAAEILARAASQPPAPPGGDGWQRLFDGQSLSGWRVTPFSGGGRVECRKGLVILWGGDPFTGINSTSEIPKTNYEVALEAMRVAGNDFFCGLTFPVRDSFCSLIVGGWSGEAVGLSSLDGLDASENETSQFISFETGRWYRIRLRVTEQKIEAWIEQKKVVDVELAGRKISVRPGDIELCEPFGLASWMTTAALRDIRIRRVTGPADSNR
jgi:hypothetical protein